MKIITICLFMIPVLFASKSSANIHEPLNQQKTIPKIKIIKIMEYETIFKFGEVSSGKLINKKTTTFNEVGKKLKTEYYSEKFQYIVSTKYDTLGYGNEVTDFNSNGSIKTVKKIKHDSNGNEIEIAIFDSNGKIESVKKYKYEKDSSNVDIISYWKFR